jgi:hypothetical protein
VPRGRPSRDAIFDRFATALEELRSFGGLSKPEEASAIWDDIWHLEPTTRPPSRATHWFCERSSNCSIPVERSAPIH